MSLYKSEDLYIVWDIELDRSMVLTDESSLKRLYEDSNSETKYEKVTVKDYMKYVGQLNASRQVLAEQWLNESKWVISIATLYFATIAFTGEEPIVSGSKAILIVIAVSPVLG